MLAEKINTRILQEYEIFFDKQESFVFVDNSSMNVSESEAFRKDLHVLGSRVLICKNRVLKILLKKRGIDCSESVMKNRTSVVFIPSDPIVIMKVIKKYQKELEKLSVKGGFLEGSFLDVKSLMSVADIPSREILFGRLFMTMKSPIQGFSGVLAGVLRKTVGVIRAIKEKKQTD